MKDVYFSIVIPVYNKEKYIGRAIESVLNQNYKKFQLIIVNDGSVDKSLDEISKYKDARIQVINQNNRGVSFARNVGVKSSNSEYIAFLDADDYWKANYLDTVEKLIRRFPTAVWFSTAYSSSGMKDPQINSEVCMEISSYIEFNQRFRFSVNSSCVVVKKKSLININGFPENISSGEDVLTWAKLSYEGKLAHSTKRLSIYDKSSIIRKPDKSKIVERSLIKIYESNRDPWLKKYTAAWILTQSELSLQNNLRYDFLRNHIKSLLMDGPNVKHLKLLFYYLLPHKAFKKLFQKWEIIKKRKNLNIHIYIP